MVPGVAVGEPPGPPAVAGPLGPPIGTAVKSAETPAVGVVDTVLVEGDNENTPMPEATGTFCAPPLLDTIPLRGSFVTVDPAEAVAVMLVGLANNDVDVNGLEPIEGSALDPLRAVGEDSGLVSPIVPTAVVPSDGVASAGVVLPAGGVEVGSFVSEPGSVGAANAMPGQLATAAPTPNATANAPTRPTYFA
ncbi:MAG: hypothetical protein WCE29_30215 [Mycobacterium sp.]